MAPTSPNPKEGGLTAAAIATNSLVEDLRHDFSQMSTPTKAQSSSKTPNCGSPTPHLRRSKIQKSHRCATAGNVDNNTTPTEKTFSIESNVINSANVANNCDEMLVDKVSVGEDLSSDNFAVLSAKGPPPKPMELGEVLAAVQGGSFGVEVVKPGSKFRCPELMFKTIEAQFLSKGMNPASLARRGRDNFKKEEKTPWEPARSFRFQGKSIPIARRGAFYCTHKAKDGKKNDCKYRVEYSYYKDHGCFIIKDTNFCLDHSHSVENVCIDVEGRFEVSKQDDLTLEEIQFIRTCAYVHCKIPQVRDGLRNQFGNSGKRTYSSH